MNQILGFFSIAIFSVFLGSQITEAFLLVPYWKTLTAVEFYEYYALWGSKIGRFYTLLTVLATLIPISVCVYCFRIKSRAQRSALLSSFFALSVVVLFYVYFKGTNEQFYEASFSAELLKSELEIWGNWHWVRILLEFLTLIYLILTFITLANKASVSHTTKMV